jgi:putative glutamine amidotransferase
MIACLIENRSMTLRANSLMPIVGVTANARKSEHNANVKLQTVSEKYAHALTDVCSAMPLFIPPLGDAICIDSLLNAVDGILLTGGAANVEPHHYGHEPAPGEDQRDPGRDYLVLPLIREALDRGVPLLGICRGLQEMNVALGGTLHQRLHEVPGRQDHRRRRDLPFSESMGPRHRLRLSPGGKLAALAGCEHADVNSLHGQGIDALAERLVVEARAEDGTIEGVSVADAPGFALGVQWHPEHAATDHPFYCAIFSAFGEAVREHAQAR